ncbi:MAG: IS256 family transposase [Chloroflexi bacterium]|jgi:putative transposase|nr:IS256 family transposase [Chloroflexota bacterium]
MTYLTNCTLPEEWLEQIAQQGLEFVPEMIRTVINSAMQIERQKHLGAGPYERTTERQGYANGYKDKTVATRMGKITFDVPQVREGNFYPQSLEKGQRSERALKLALAEMYIQGVSTRRVKAITEQLCGFEVSSTQVSQATALLDEQLQAWRERPLGRMKYLYLDARYEKVRQEGQVRDAAVLVAVGVNQEGKREVLGVSVSLSEQEVHWRTFMESLVARGLAGLELIVSDAHTGLQTARKAVFGGIPWQRCQFHLQQNAQAYVPQQNMKAEVAADIRAIFNAPNLLDAEALLKKTVQKYTRLASKLAVWMENNLPQGLTVFTFPASQRRLIRTTNGLERLNREIRRRSRVAALFPNEESCLRLVTAILMEISEEWQTGRSYLRPDAD